MKKRVPAAPQPSFGDATALSSESFFAQQQSVHPLRSTASAAHPMSAIAVLDAAFLNRTAVVTLWVGAVLTLCILAGQSAPIAISFAIGAGLSICLLKSQQWFLARFVAMSVKSAAAYQGWDARFPLWVLVPLKYAVVAAVIGFALRNQAFVPAAFAVGFTVLQVVIFARVAGRLLKANLRPIDQVYIGNAKNR